MYGSFVILQKLRSICPEKIASDLLWNCFVCVKIPLKLLRNGVEIVSIDNWNRFECAFQMRWKCFRLCLTSCLTSKICRIVINCEWNYSFVEILFIGIYFISNLSTHLFSLASFHFHLFDLEYSLQFNFALTQQKMFDTRSMIKTCSSEISIRLFTIKSLLCFSFVHMHKIVELFIRKIPLNSHLDIHCMA